MFPSSRLLTLLTAALACAQPAGAQAREAALQYYRYQSAFLQIYSRALDHQNGLAAAQSIEMLTDEFIQWGQRVVAEVGAADFRAAMQSSQADRARALCDESIAIVQQKHNERSSDSTNFIMLDSRFNNVRTRFTGTLREFRETMGL